MSDTKARAVDTGLIRELALLLDETGLTEIEVGAGEGRIRIARQAPAQMTAPQMLFQAPAAAAPAAAPAAAAPAAPAAADPAGHPGAVPSPMVGTVYLAPEPGAPADHRSHEGDEPHPRPAERHRQPASGAERPAGRVRRAACDHRVTRERSCSRRC
jgi:hypothetical protein